MNIEKTGPVHELVWFKSSYSGGAGGECVEVAVSPRAVHVRDSKDSSGADLALGPDAWAAFLRLVSR